MDHSNLQTESMENKRHHHPQASLTNKRNPTSITNRTTTPAIDTMAATHSDNQKGKQPQQHTQWKQHTRTTQKVKSKQATNTTTWRPQQNSKDTPRASHRSIKWQPQARLKIQWTRQHLDSYLALAEVSCEWNVEPG